MIGLHKEVRPLMIKRNCKHLSSMTSHQWCSAGYVGFSELQSKNTCSRLDPSRCLQPFSTRSLTTCRHCYLQVRVVVCSTTRKISSTWSRKYTRQSSKSSRKYSNHTTSTSRQTLTRWSRDSSASMRLFSKTCQARRIKNTWWSWTMCSSSKILRSGFVSIWRGLQLIERTYLRGVISRTTPLPKSRQLLNVVTLGIMLAQSHLKITRTGEASLKLRNLILISWQNVISWTTPCS